SRTTRKPPTRPVSALTPRSPSSSTVGNSSLPVWCGPSNGVRTRTPSRGRAIPLVADTSRESASSPDRTTNLPDVARNGQQPGQAAARGPTATTRGRAPVHSLTRTFAVSSPGLPVSGRLRPLPLLVEQLVLDVAVL